MQIANWRSCATFLLMFLGSIGASGSLRAQSIEPSDYGVQDSEVLFVSATDFAPAVHGNNYFADAFDYVNWTSANNGVFTRQLQLPTGASVESMRLYFFDATLGNNASIQLCKSAIESDTGTNPSRSCTSPVSSDFAPGYGSVLLPVNETFLTKMQADGDPALEDVRWIIVVTLPSETSNLRFGGVKVTWKRQVSPAPTAATFADVPTTHPFFRFVEALADAGITGGCGGGNYCPDAPITRGQMAVFLSAALGLHWAP